MALNFSPEADDDRPVLREKESNQRILLLVLVLLVVVFGYLYFFTGLIRPLAEAPNPPPVQTARVKIPLPPRPEQGGEKQESAANPPGMPPAPVPVGKPAPVSVQPAPAKSAKAEEKPVQKEQSPAPGSPAVAARKQEQPVPKTAIAATNVGGKVSGAGAATQKPAKPAAKHGAYTLLVGEFAADQELKSALTRLKKGGVTPVHRKKVTKLELMHRLFLAEFNDHDAASAELRRLQRVTVSAFMLRENGKYRVYAGSYLHEGGADNEQERLAGKGVKLTRKSAKVIIPKTIVTAGAFSTREDAQKGVNRLKKRGLTATVVKTGKQAG
jgi:hypothetical protein